VADEQLSGTGKSARDGRCSNFPYKSGREATRFKKIRSIMIDFHLYIHTN